MRRVAVVLLFLGMVSTTSLLAQKKISIGPVAGVNFATWSGDDAGENLSRRTGFHAGMQINADLGRVIGFQSGAMYSQEGTKVDAGGGISGTFKVDYVRVPILLRARLATGSQLVPYVVAGPSLGIKVSCKVEATDGEQTQSRQCDDPVLGFNLKTFDFGMVLGVGFDFGKFSAGVRYVPGLQSIDDINTESADVHNSLLAITAGYAF